MEDLKLEKLNKKDKSEVVELSTLVGWNYTDEEVHTIFQAGHVYGHRTRSGRVISSSAIFPYGEHMACIGVVIVHPTYRGRGLGKEIVQKCLDQCPDCPVILIATPKGFPIYDRLGFKTMETIYKMTCDQYRPFANIRKDLEYTTSPYSDESFNQLVKLDGLAMGANRERFLKARMAQAKKCIIVKTKNGEIVGFGLSVQSTDYLVVGPIVAPNVASTKLVLHKLVEHHKGKLRIDVPGEQKHFLKVLESSGFDYENQLPLMAIHEQKLLNKNGSLFSIAGSAYG